MSDPKIVDLPPDQRVAAVLREWRSKGCVYACLDARKQVLILSQRVSHVQAAIESLCNQRPSMTSLFESVGHRQRRGYTAGTWSVVRLTPADLPAFVDEHRSKYQRVVIASDNPRKWRLSRCVPIGKSILGSTTNGLLGE